MILLGGNKITADMMTITGGSSAFGAERCINQIAEEVTQFNDNIVIDFGSAVDITSIAVVNASTNMTIEANATDSWGAPSYSATLDDIPGSTCRIDIPSSTQSYRYWRLKSAGLAYVGYLYLGEYTLMPGRKFGDLPSLARIDAKTKTVGGGTLVKPGYTNKDLKGKFTSIDDDELSTLRTYWSNNGELPAIMVPFEDHDQATLDEVYTPFYCNPMFDFGPRSAKDVNSVTAEFVETK